jgi:hypothetical protein
MGDLFNLAVFCLRSHSVWPVVLPLLPDRQSLVLLLRPVLPRGKAITALVLTGHLYLPAGSRVWLLNFVTGQLYFLSCRSLLHYSRPLHRENHQPLYCQTDRGYKEGNPGQTGACNASSAYRFLCSPKDYLRILSLPRAFFFRTSGNLNCEDLGELVNAYHVHYPAKFNLR